MRLFLVKKKIKTPILKQHQKPTNFKDIKVKKNEKPEEDEEVSDLHWESTLNLNCTDPNLREMGLLHCLRRQILCSPVVLSDFKTAPEMAAIWRNSTTKAPESWFPVVG